MRQTVRVTDPAEDLPTPDVEAPQAPTSTRSIASGIYGLVVAGATLATAAAKESLHAVALSVLVTVLVYWAAEGYAHALAQRMVERHALTRDENLRVLRQGWPLVSASYLPLLALLIAGAAGAEVSTAALVALIVTTVLLGVAGFSAGRRSGVQGLHLLWTTTATLSFGVVMIALKLWLTH